MTRTALFFDDPPRPLHVYCQHYTPGETMWDAVWCKKKAVGNLPGDLLASRCRLHLATVEARP